MPAHVEPRRRERSEDVADLVGPLEVDGHEIRPVPVVEVARDPLRHAGGGHDAPERDDRALHPGAARESGRDLSRRHVEVRGEVLRGDLPVPRDDLRDARRDRRRERHAFARQIGEEDRARTVGDEEAVDLLRRMRRPPADDSDLAPVGRGEVPGRGRAPRVAGDRTLAPRLRVDLLEVENAVDVGRHAGRRRRPEDRRDQRVVARKPRRVALGREPLPVRHLPVGREAVEKLEVEAIEAEPENGRPGSRRSRLARRRIRRLDGSLHRRRADGGCGRLAAARQPQKERRRERPDTRKPHPRQHSRGFDPPCP